MQVIKILKRLLSIILKRKHKKRKFTIRKGGKNMAYVKNKNGFEIGE